MATNTYVALASQTLTGNTSSVTFSSIPQNYKDLVLVMEYAGSIAAEVPAFRLNGDTTGTYSVTHLSANGSTPRSARASNATSAYISYSSAFPQTLMMNSVIHFMSYSNSVKHKAALIRTDSRDGTYNATEINATLWRSNDAITSITLIGTNGASYYTGSTFILYGIAAEAPAPKATGGTIYTDAEYYYHLFGTTGAFVPSQSLTADILVVAGGGGGQELGGGAGAGGLLEFSSQSLSATSYTVTVGAGGAGGYNGTGTVGAQGGNSQFGALTAVIGGGGGGRYDVNGGSGGSGGGGGRGSTSGGSGTSGQGSAGGGGNGQYAAGGGGGAGQAGASAPSGTQAGNGGNGVTSNLIQKIGSAINAGHLVNGTYYFAGGGGGGVQNYAGFGTGGYGGGGRGGSDQSTPARGTNGMPNTGGGAGGGSGANNYGGNGGSGVVIVRYLK